MSQNPYEHIIKYVTTTPENMNKNVLVTLFNNIKNDKEEDSSDKVVRLIDWEGTVLKEYTKNEIEELVELPTPDTFTTYSNVDHDLLLFQEWNWSLADIKTWLMNHSQGKLNVGAIYTTTDGQDHNYWASPRGEGMSCISIQKKGTASIGNNDFNGYCSLTSINIPDGVTSIGNDAFNSCYSLKSINIPNSVTSIGDNAFTGCLSLTSINIPNSVTSIMKDAFQNCCSLTSINIPNSVTSIGDNAFYNCDSLTSINIPDGVTDIGSYAFYNCVSLTSINIPDGVTYIGSYAFSDCYSLISINILDGVTYIGNSAFSNCYSLISINIPDSITSIGDNAFNSCYSLTSINIPDGVTSIGSYAFGYCRSLTSINIPDSVTSIGGYAFQDCSNLFDILLEGKPAFPDSNILAGVPSTVKIYVPRENLSLFEAITDGAGLYSKFAAIEDNITYLESLGYNVDKYKN